MSRIRPFLPNLPDCDDTLRRLADVLLVPETCRKRACRKAMRCQGGYGRPASSSGSASSPGPFWTT
jgi:hypothetical protein